MDEQIKTPEKHGKMIDLNITYPVRGEIYMHEEYLVPTEHAKQLYDSYERISKTDEQRIIDAINELEHQTYFTHIYPDGRIIDSEKYTITVNGLLQGEDEYTKNINSKKKILKKY